MGWNWFDMHTIKLNTLCPSNATNTHMRIYRMKRISLYEMRSWVNEWVCACFCIDQDDAIRSFYWVDWRLPSKQYSKREWAPGCERAHIQCSSILIHVYHISILNKFSLHCFRFALGPSQCPLNALEFITVCRCWVHNCNWNCVWHSQSSLFIVVAVAVVVAVVVVVAAIAATAVIRLLQFPLQYFHLNAHSIYTRYEQANLLSFVFLVTSLFAST